MYDLGVSYTFHFCKKNTESSIIFLRNAILILNGKENKEATAICLYWDKDSEEKEQGITEEKEQGIIT